MRVGFWLGLGDEKLGSVGFNGFVGLGFRDGSKMVGEGFRVGLRAWRRSRDRGWSFFGSCG